MDPNAGFFVVLESKTIGPAASLQDAIDAALEAESAGETALKITQAPNFTLEGKALREAMTDLE